MERKEPTLSGIAPDTDEIEERQVPRPEGSKAPRERPARESVGNRPTTARPRRTAAAAAPPAASSNALVIVALLLALIGVGGSAYLGWQFYMAEQELVQSQARITDLERRLDVTYDESVGSIEAVQAKLQWADSEIRKLWGVSYDTNRGNITANREQIAALKKDLESVRGNANASRSALDGLNNSVAQVQASVTELEKGLDAVQGQQQQLQNLREQLDQLSDRLTQVSALASRVETNEEAIAAIDAYRRSINRDLMALKAQLAQ